MSGGRPIGRDEIRALLHELAAALPPGSRQHLVVMVGGALLAWHGLRDATRDVDSVHRLDAELQTAARSVAVVHDLAPAWVNHHAAGFAPQTLRAEDCERLIEHPRLLVLGAPLRQVFLMKLFAGRDRDQGYRSRPGDLHALVARFERTRPVLEPTLAAQVEFALRRPEPSRREG